MLHHLDLNADAARTVLLVHGLGSNNAGWQGQTGALRSAGWRVLVPDMPGFGDSPFAGGRWRIADAAAELAALLHALQPAGACVAGISMGGTVALQLALDYPQLVQRLVLVSTFARLRARGPRQLLYFARRYLLLHLRGLPSQARAVAQHVFPLPAQENWRAAFYQQILQSDVRAYRSAMLALARFDVQSRLAAVRVPTLVITGSQDATVLPENQAGLVHGIAGARQLILNGGHAIMVEQPQAFNAALLQFLSDSHPAPL